MRIELTFSGWKPDVITTIRYLLIILVIVIGLEPIRRFRQGLDAPVSTNSTIQQTNQIFEIDEVSTNKICLSTKSIKVINCLLFSMCGAGGNRTHRNDLAKVFRQPWNMQPQME